MELHNNKEVFHKLLEELEAHTGFKTAIIEKDYYVTLFLKTLSEKLPNMIFKGGTSLSKCYHAIKRFSEDIDISVDYSKSLTQGEYKKIKQAVVESAAELGFEILNLEDTRSRRDFNQYKIQYPGMFMLGGIKQFLFLETSVAVRAFPTEMKSVKSYVQEFLEEQEKDDLINQYSLSEFSVRTQCLDRTFVDKLFALGDYYLTGAEAGHSRHLYDLHKLLPHITFDDAFRALIKEVREVRKTNKYCHSAQEGIDIQKVLLEIIEKDSYKKDYTEALSVLLHEDISYTEAKNTLSEILKKNIF